LKAGILLVLVLATIALVVSLGTIGSPRTVALDFLPKAMKAVPLTYVTATLSMLLSIVGLTFLGRSWERDSLSAAFIERTKIWAVFVLLISILPGIIFLSVLFQELRR